VPAVDEVHAALAAGIPEQQGVSIVHGDYRLDNAIVTGEGKVAALLDWELCTLGDPLADLGLLLVYWSEPTDDYAPLGVAATMAPGFCTRAELTERYAAASGRDLSDIAFYTAFGYWKLACILEGVYTRYRGGSGGGDQSDISAYPKQIDDLSKSARKVISSVR
jgi:aminoglycoside phosphotransferase (APT) family kinase protein